MTEADMKALFTVSFTEICRMFDADPYRIDNMCYATFGMSGDELMEQYRSGTMNLIE